jgi:nitrogen regulatory protein PII-like uncharacterized protein
LLQILWTKNYLKSIYIYTSISKSPKLKEEEESPRTQTYKGVDPLGSDHIDMKVDEKLEQAVKLLEEELKVQILKILQVELTKKFKKEIRNMTQNMIFTFQRMTIWILQDMVNYPNK